VYFEKNKKFDIFDIKYDVINDPRKMGQRLANASKGSVVRFPQSDRHAVA